MRDTGPTRPPQTFRALFVKISLTLALFFLALFTLPAWLLVDDFATGFGAGAMAAVWGGPGFGVMITGLVWQDPEDTKRPPIKPAEPTQ